MSGILDDARDTLRKSLANVNDARAELLLVLADLDVLNATLESTRLAKLARDARRDADKLDAIAGELGAVVKETSEIDRAFDAMFERGEKGDPRGAKGIARAVGKLGDRLAALEAAIESEPLGEFEELKSKAFAAIDRRFTRAAEAISEAVDLSDVEGDLEAVHEWLSEDIDAAKRTNPRGKGRRR